jgi:hypothetical protein
MWFRYLQRRTFLFALVSLIALVPIFGLFGCTRAIRDEASKVAKAGRDVSRQMAEYLETLQQDTTDTYELNAFREAYLLQKSYDRAVQKAKDQRRPLPPPPSFQMSDMDKQVLREYQQTYQALAARIRLARAMQDAYESYAQLSAYDSTQEVLNSMDGLIKTVSAAADFPLPGLGSASSVVQGLFKDIVRELTTIQQNRKLLKNSELLIPIIQKLKAIFDQERILYGGDSVVVDSNGVSRRVSGIAGRRAAAYKSTARELVESDAVISTALVNRVLSRYQLRWPEPQVPFTQPAMKGGIVKIIESRAFPLAQLSDDVSDKISKGLGGLIKLHRELAVKKPLSLQEVISNSATAQVLLDQLKDQGLPANFFVELFNALQKGTPK